MQYRLIKGSLNDPARVKETVFLNRGIEDIAGYTSLTDKNFHSYELLSNISEAASEVVAAVDGHKSIHILVDCDTDGYTSAAIMYSYIKRWDDNADLSYSIHAQKEHGLESGIVIPDETDLLIIPDAGSADIEQCKQLTERGIKVVILDHHECEAENPYAIVVNNQMCEYPNKFLSGVGVTYKLLQAIDDIEWNSYADSFLDLVALGLIGDSMDIRTFENRRLIEKGLSHINSKLFKALVDKQSYSMGDEVNIHTIQFYIVPLINAMIRAGDSDEKELLFRAFIETDEVFQYKKRGEDKEVPEDIYTRAARLCSNAKSRQDKLRTSGLYDVVDHVKANGFDKNKIIFANVTDILGATMTGVVAIKVAEYFGRPCLLLREKREAKGVYGGSARNINNSPIVGLKDFLNSLGAFESASGHQNAFGVEIKKENIPKAISIANEKLSDTDFSKFFEVDFSLDYQDLDISLIKEIFDLRDYYGSRVDEPLVHISNIPVEADQISIMGKEKNTWKITTDEGIAFIKFKCKEDDPVISAKANGSRLHVSVVGTAGFNTYKSIRAPQITVLDYEVGE